MLKQILFISLLLIVLLGCANTKDLTKWKLSGIGEIRKDKTERAFRLTEGNNSKGIVLLSNKFFPKDLSISFDVKPLQFQGVCVVFFSASSLDGTTIYIPENYDGNSDFWISPDSKVKSYAIAFHTGFHQPNILIKKNPGWKSLSETKDVVTEEKWYKIGITAKENIIVLSVNGIPVLESKDDHDVLGGGQIGLRIRGLGDGSLSVLYKNLKIMRIK